MFDPTNPSKQIVLTSAEPTIYPGAGHSDEIDVTGFRFLMLGVNVPGGAFPIPPPGSTIEIDGLGPDGLWIYQLAPPFNINVVGPQLIRAFQPLTPSARIAWNLPAAGAFGYWLIGQS